MCRRKANQIAEVMEIGTVKVGITALAKNARNRIKKETGKDPRNLDLDVQLEIAMASGKGVLEAVAKIDKKKVGSTTIMYDAGPAWQSGLVHEEDS